MLVMILQTKFYLSLDPGESGQPSFARHGLEKPNYWQSSTSATGATRKFRVLLTQHRIGCNRFEYLERRDRKPGIIYPRWFGTPVCDKSPAMTLHGGWQGTVGTWGGSQTLISQTFVSIFFSFSFLTLRYRFLSSAPVAGKKGNIIERRYRAYHVKPGEGLLFSILVVYHSIFGLILTFHFLLPGPEIVFLSV
jgi:hypothetical protein